MPTTNCGLRALEQMASLKNVSAFTLIHLAKDNGVNLYFCQVEQNELVSVARPAIFHQNNHFVFVEDGMPMPPGEYDGYVLTPKPLHEPLPYSLAKKVRGQKGGGNVVSSIVIAVTAMIPVIGPPLAAAEAAALATHQTTGGGGYFGDESKKGEFWRIPVNAATAYLSGGGNLLGTTTTGGRALLASTLAAGSEIPGAVKTGNWMTPVKAGMTQYGMSRFTQGAAQGVAQAGGNIGDKIWAAGQGGLAGIGIGKPPAPGMSMMPTTTPGAATPMSMATATPGISSNVAAPVAGITTPSAAALSAPGTNLSAVAPGMSMAPAAATTANIGAQAAKQATSSTSFWDKAKSFMPTSGGVDKTTTAGMLAQMGVNAMMQAPRPTSDSPTNYSKAAEYLGNENYQALPTAVRTQLEEYVNTPIEQLATKFTLQNDQGLRLLEEQKRKTIDQTMVSYANMGQDPYTSTAAQQALTEINRQYDQAAAELQQQNQQKGLADAIKFKQDMLVQAIQQNKFDYEGFIELAKQMGIEQDALTALDRADYGQLQTILGTILSNTFGAGPEEKTV